ncbi:MAG: glycosyltransferase [Lachnospiraceae bacterium]|nr:glycosyltransferase [Lachnospiraceae bacterium]
MRVAIINTVIGTGSVGRIACGTADEIMKNGGEALLCRGRGEEINGYVNYRVGSDPDMFFHGIMTRITDKHGLYSKNATHHLIKKLEEFNPDIIQLHNIHGYYVNYPILFDWLKDCGRPVVWTLHDCWSFTGHCVHYEYCGCDKWEVGDCSYCPEKSEYPASYIKDASKSNMTLKKQHFTGIPDMHLVTPSEWLKEAVSRSIMKEYPVQVINTGIDIGAFRPVSSEIRNKHGIGDRSLLLGIANPWRERKGYNDFAELYNMLEKQYPGKYAIAMIGPQNPRQIELPEEIIRIGHISSVGELAEWYSAADIYVNLTYGDTFPTTNIEALACGTPVITYNAGGSGEAVTKETGAVIPKSDLGEVIAASERIIAKLRGKDGERIKSSCVEQALRYNKQDKYREYYELYQKI